MHQGGKQVIFMIIILNKFAILIVVHQSHYDNIQNHYKIENPKQKGILTTE